VLKLSINSLCNIFGKTRQAYYKSVQKLQMERYRIEMVLQLVRDIRKFLPKVGTRKLHQMLKNDFRTLGYKIGRDKLFSILRDNSLLLERKRSFQRTTYSNHWYMVFPNLISNFFVFKPNQVLVSDLTYIRTKVGFVYLSLITDLYSRKILGYCLSRDLTATGCIRSLQMALKQIDNPEGMIHHSDRGIQYCCDDYMKVLDTNKIRVSMTEESHCYENAVAERVNGILKDEFLLNSENRMF